MPLSDLVVFNEYLQSTMTEILDQQYDVFNSKSNNTIILKPSSYNGDFADASFFKKVSGLVRRRNAYGSGAQAKVAFGQLADTMVKIAAGTVPVNLDPGQFKWIKTKPKEAGVALGMQLAPDMMADMLNTALLGCSSALSQVAALNYNGTLDTPNTFNLAMQAKGLELFGDRLFAINAWLMHSHCFHDMYQTNITNAERLFTYGTVSIMRDPLGKVFVITDSQALVDATPDYYTLGLVSGACEIGQNDDFTDVLDERSGDENIEHTFQAEWTYNLGVKGFAWNKTTGGASPTDAAIGTAANWTRINTFDKDLAGVRVQSK